MLNLVLKALTIILTCIIALGTVIIVSAFGLIGLMFRVITAVLCYLETGLVYVTDCLSYRRSAKTVAKNVDKCN